MNDKQLMALVKRLSTAEKAVLCSGADTWTTKANRRLGIPPLRMADGPHGLRREDAKNAKANGGHSRPATCFPPAVAQACSFSPALARQVGQAIAEECLAEGVGLLLGPGVNIKRSPLGGRNFEYYSEDPLLAGELAAGFIAGVQSKGVGTSLKHYAVNNQEKWRMSIDAAVDERALFDLYLKPFEIAVGKAQPATVMASYNQINGRYATENRRLLTDILRLRFGFGGAVVTDWGAIHSRTEALNAGCDLEMPASGGVGDWAILQGVRSGMLSEDALNAACFNLLRLIFRYRVPPSRRIPCDYKAHHQLAVTALEQSAVLLHNNGMLPLREGEPVAMIGEMAQKPRYQGGGSSIVNPKQLVSFCAAMEREGLPIQFAPGYRGTEADEALVQGAVAAAQSCKQALLFLGLPDSYECEGYDRKHLKLPENQLALLKAVRAACPNVCVVLCCGAPVEAGWVEQHTEATLLLHLGGEGVGEAALRLLYGRANPSGKLAESWPMALEDVPCAHHFPGGPLQVQYNESIYVGYRYYATAGVPVRYPFGYGLSYTRYEYKTLKLASGEKLAPGQPLKAVLTLQNTGEVAGDEIVQLYLRRMGSACHQPARELKAFARVTLAAGQQKKLALVVPYKELGYHDEQTGQTVVEAGQYEVQLGPNSEDLPLKARFEAEGAAVQPKAAAAASGSYGHIKSNRFEQRDFAALYGRPLNNNRPPRKGEYGTTTPLGQMGGSAMGRLLEKAAQMVGRRSFAFTKDKRTNHQVATEMASDMPFKNLVVFSRGILSPAAAAALLDVCNGTGGLLRFGAALLRRQPYRKLNRRRW